MKKRYRILITEHAQKDLEHIFYYIAEDSPENASIFIREVEKNIYSLELFPERCPLIAENEYFKTDYRHLVNKKYRTIFRIINNTVYILRIIHGTRIFEL